MENCVAKWEDDFSNELRAVKEEKNGQKKRSSRWNSYFLATNFDNLAHGPTPLRG